MVNATFTKSFKRKFAKIKEKSTKQKIIKQFSKIRDNPEMGKPIRYLRKGTREVYISPFRLSYIFINNEIIFLDLYHKDVQ